MDTKMLEGKIALITGASYGMGLAIAELFAEEGAVVALVARGKEKLDAAAKGITDKGYRAIGIVADIGSMDDTLRVFDTVQKELGGLDILINNAGLGDMIMIDETNDEGVDRIMNVNFNGALRYTCEALKIFLPKNY